MGKEREKPTRRGLPAPAGWLAAVVLLAAAVLPYLNSLQGSFHFDDDHVIVRNEQIRSLGGVLSARPINRLLMFLTFWSNYRLHGLTIMPGWHAVNILLHAGCVLTLYWLLRRMVPGAAAAAAPAAFYGALLLAVHPLASEPVNYLQARNVLLYTLFSLLGVAGLTIAQQGRRRDKVAGAALLAGSLLLAALSKEAGSFFAPAAAGLYWLLFIAAPAPRKGRYWLVGLAALVAVAAASLSWLSYTGALPAIARRVNQDFWNHLWGQMTVFWRYVGLAFWPSPDRLTVDHFVPYHYSQLHRIPYQWYHQQVLVGLAGLALVAVAAVWQVRKRPHVSYFLLLLPLGVAPYFVMTTPEMMVEYRFYLPLAGFCALAGAGLAAVLARARRLGLAVLVGLCVVLAAATAVRNRAWRTDIALWEDALSKEPHKARTLNGLAWALATDPEHPDPPRALELALLSVSNTRYYALAKGLLTDPDHPQAARVLRPILEKLDKQDLLIDFFPGYNPYMLDTLAEAYYANGLHQEAIQVEQDLLQSYPQEVFFKQQLAKYIAARDARRGPQTQSRPVTIHDPG